MDVFETINVRIAEGKADTKILENIVNNEVKGIKDRMNEID